MAFDLVVKNGIVVDGTGGPRFHADIGVNGGKITAIGRLSDKAHRTVDAEGHVGRVWRNVNVDGHDEEVLVALREMGGTTVT